ncbi:MAG: DUF6485 family protein [Promethearchaeota archaeon]
MSCPNQEKNLSVCNCTYGSCARKGLCCECVAYHRAHRELPACYFPTDVEKTFDRSIERFVALYK